MATICALAGRAPWARRFWGRLRGVWPVIWASERQKSSGQKSPARELSSRYFRARPNSS